MFTALLSFINSSVLTSSETTEADQAEKLRTLGYVDWAVTKNVEKKGVVHYDAELASKGVSLYTSRPLQEADLIDMRGNVVHKWLWKPEGAVDQEFLRASARVYHIKTCENGDLLVIAKSQMLVRLDWDSNVKWKRKMQVHHDVSVDPEGKIYAVAREHGIGFWHGIPVPILGDYIVVLSPDGEIEKKIHLYGLIKDHLSLRTIVKRYMLAMRAEFDIMHTNSLEIMDRDIEGFCRKGDWLISMRNLDLIGVVDPKKEELVWSWGPGELEEQHHPTLLKNGNVLIFDNGSTRGFSRVIELNPLTREIEWEYKSEPPEKFFSNGRGASQRLPNGNTLITESDKGHAFEITKDGKVVWEFYSPHVNEEKKERAVIYRLMRVNNSGIDELLKKGDE